MLRQYFATKCRYPGTLLAMRVGDFYEFYGEDAETAARALEITLTGREDGPNGRVPMAGVPFHAAQKYIAILVKQGFKVAICDQVEDPKTAKGLVERAVTRVLTPGTVVEGEMLDSGANNFLASAAPYEGGAGISFLDLSTGEFLVTEVAGDDAQERTLQEIARFNPAECLLPEEADELYGLLGKLVTTMVTRTPFASVRDAKNRLMRQFGTSSLAPFGLENMDAGSSAAGTILKYLDQNEVQAAHVDHLTTYSLDSRMRLDGPTARSLELVANMSDGGKRMTLRETLDFTKTPMGGRLLKRWIEEPLLEADQIEKRLDAVEAMATSGLARDEIRGVLHNLSDVERLVAGAGSGFSNARDLVALRKNIALFPDLLAKTHRVGRGLIEDARKRIELCEDVLGELFRGLADDPPFSLREGGIIRPGYDHALDEFHRMSLEGRKFIAELEATERSRTGIEKLKVGYNSVFGYFLEVPKAQVAKVPESYIRKQTVANAERYITAELKGHEANVLGADEKAFDLEYRIFAKLRECVASAAARINRTARAIAEIDAVQSLAEAASMRGYVRPELVSCEEGGQIEIEGGRHPVVEAHKGLGAFVPNDTDLGDDLSLVILTGPNMSGKSTYLRQTALIALMAQIGSFVPAKRARLAPLDRVFARIGARDELASGQSTFMVEMTEAANILHHATPRSLVILDEIGRGTSTFDGLAIAWSIAEHLARRGTPTLFATHYHQLNALAESLPKVANYRVAVREDGEQVIWLHRVLEGGTDRSYGIQVARMAGVPKDVLRRAAEVLADLEGEARLPVEIAPPSPQLTLFREEESDIARRIREMDVETITPIEALILLDNLKRESAK
jgi:DNA mismatch repair protein MutS